MSDQGTMTGKPLIESDRVEGTAVYDPKATISEDIKRLYGWPTQSCPSVAFSGWAQKSTRSLEQADLDTNLGGYRTDITEDQLRRSRVLSQPRLGLERSPGAGPARSGPAANRRKMKPRADLRQLQRR